MARKKHRKALRYVRMRELWPAAAKMFFKEEDERMYREELAQINNDTMSCNEIMLRSRMAWQHSWGRAYMNYITWQMGFIRLDFRCSRSHGKVRAKDLIVLRVNKQED